MNKTIVLTGIFFGVSAVLLGAFGAHGLKRLIDTEAIQTFNTGVTYQMYHALFLLVLGGLPFVSEKQKKPVYYCVLFGIVLFSFSIYGLATNGLTEFDFKKIAFLTPLGGSLLVLGWIFLGIRIFRENRTD
ncbi:MAG: DUF423 domain-containing protein [Bacteroidota bacterium]